MHADVLLSCFQALGSAAMKALGNRYCPKSHNMQSGSYAHSERLPLNNIDDIIRRRPLMEVAETQSRVCSLSYSRRMTGTRIHGN